MNDKLMKLFKNNVFAEKAAACETVEEVLAMIKAEGIETTREEFDSFMDYMAKTSSEHEGELDEGELEQVSGGGGFFTFAAVVSTVVAVVGAAKWYIYDEPYERGKQDAKAKNNQRKNAIC